MCRLRYRTKRRCYQAPPISLSIAIILQINQKVGGWMGGWMGGWFKSLFLDCIWQSNALMLKTLETPNQIKRMTDRTPTFEFENF